VPEATPQDLFSTERITAFVLGDEKRAKPKPGRARLAMIKATAL
jgi:hypothetical protein